MKVDASITGQKTLEAFKEKTTPWRSIYISFLLQMLAGIQFSIFITSMWPYLISLEADATLSFFGWVMAIFSVGQMASSWLFGYWSQKTMSTRYPTACGLLFTAFGNLIYAFLPSLSANQRWFMLLARLLVGFGSGNLCVLRGYCAMACNKKDLARVMPLAAGSNVLGLALGPAIQALFVPLRGGAVVSSVVLSMYTVPAFLMVGISLISFLILLIFFQEEYAGVISKEEKKDPYFVVPKFDRIAAFTCIYIYFVFQTITTSIESISTPFTISLYNWTDAKALFYNGVLQFVGSSLDIVNYLLISFTRIGKFDQRAMLVLSALGFIVYHIFTLPWQFYDGPLDYMKLGPNSTIEDTSFSGGCFRSYEWCAHTTRVPLPLYVFGFTVILSFGFPYTAAPIGVLFPAILGPRKQGKMQGAMEFFGSLARCITPIIQMYMFQHSGYLWPSVMNLFVTTIGLTFLVLFYDRIIPLRLIPKVGMPTRYKSGVFYRL